MGLHIMSFVMEIKLKITSNFLSVKMVTFSVVYVFVNVNYNSIFAIELKYTKRC